MGTSSNHEANQSLLAKLRKKNDNVLRRKPNPEEQCRLSHQIISLKQVFCLLTAYLGGGTICFFLIRNQIQGRKTTGVIDSIYFSVVTMTTVGYGDLVPATTMAKLFSCAYVFAGMVIGGLILSKAADYIVEKQELLFISYLIHPSPKHRNDTETQKLKFKLITTGLFLCFFVVLGVLFLWFVEKMAMVDALYCVCSTITTLGYGDESFSTGLGRVFAVVWIMSSTVCLGQLLLYVAELQTERRRKWVVNWVLSRKLTFSDLEAADLDHDHVVSAAEFVIYKLKEMEKINEEDIANVMETFRKLDVDQSGSLTQADL